MNTISQDSLNPFEWAKKEFSVDPTYWQDRAKNGSGLIKQIANFVIKHAGKAAGSVKK